MVYRDRDGEVGEGESTEQRVLRLRTFIKEGAGRAGCRLGRGVREVGEEPTT